MELKLLKNEPSTTSNQQDTVRPVVESLGVPSEAFPLLDIYIDDAQNVRIYNPITNETIMQFDLKA